MALDYNNYKGNDDFRGFLAANGFDNFLKYTGNDGGVDREAMIRYNHPDGTGFNTANDLAFEYAGTHHLVKGLYDNWSANRNKGDKPNKQINITPEQRAEFLGKLREAYAMPEGNLKEIRARRIAIGEAIREVRDQIPSSKWDKFTTLWKAGLLTAPTTHIRNIAGNVINGGSEKVAQTIGSAFDWMISKGTGKAYNFLRDFINPEAIYTYT